MSGTPPRVICTCTRCWETRTLNSFGQYQQGKLVPVSTRAYHRKHDKGHLQREPEQVPGHASGLPISSSEPLVREAPPLLQQVEGGDATTSGSDSKDSLSALRRSLIVAVCTLAAWLHVVCGLSLASTTQTLKAIGMIIQLAIKLGNLFSEANTSLPSDARTAVFDLSIEPTIRRSVCCPKCFKHYEIESLPDICTFRETPRSWACGEKLWTVRTTRGGPRRVPRRLYCTQDFDSWLEFFLSRPGIEDIIDASYAHHPSPDNMRSILDSPAWRSLGADGTFSSTPGNLTFSYYIDWYNPFMNKIAGKHVSCGAVMLFCLNLPLNIQYLPENTFFAGIIPPPHEPTITTITAVTDPIVEALKPFWQGKMVKSHRHPQGSIKHVAVLARIGDLGAIKKAMGYAAHKADQFCSFCKLSRSNIDDLNYRSWEKRNGKEVLEIAKEWKAATTKKRRHEIFQDHGVRWSSFHALPYGDPVKHTMLGLMHNWLEGILQHHVRVRWGLGINIPSSKNKVSNQNQDADPEAGPDGVNNAPLGSADAPVFQDVLHNELEALFDESRMHDDNPIHSGRLRLRSEASFILSTKASDLSGDSEDDDSEDDDDFQPGSDSDDDSSNENDSTVKMVCVFSLEELQAVRACISSATIPSWVERPPGNLGEKSHGKLKADQWFTLFTVFLPLILPELWASKKRTDVTVLDYSSLLRNFYCLVTCTNILCSYVVTTDSPNTYLDHYVEYRESSQVLFPGIATRPNHHYAMHNAELMKYWGPLIRVSEFAGERHNGRLQKIKTNSHLWEIDFTMLRQMCRRGRLLAVLRGPYPQPETELAAMNDVLLPVPSSDKEDPSGAGFKKIPIDVYQAILIYVNRVRPPQSPMIRHAQNMPHPDCAPVLPRFAIPVKRFEWKGRNYSTFDLHAGNSAIYFNSKISGENTGHIESIWRLAAITNNGTPRTFIAVSKHQHLSRDDRKCSPYLSCPGYLASVVYTRKPDQLCLEVIEEEDIVGHVAYYDRPLGTFGIFKPATVVVNSLHRYRD